MLSLKKFTCGIATALTVGMVSAAHATGPHEAPIREFGAEVVKSWVSNPLILDAIRAQNSRNAGLSEDQIIALDQQWRAETKTERRPLIDGVLANAVSKYLSDMKDEQRGVVTEVFVMDNRGLNVGQSDVTSDYWQGDEAKWKQTYLVGPGAIMIDGVELDESTQTFQSQLNMAITDEAGEVIGAITIGIDVEAIIWTDVALR